VATTTTLVTAPAAAVRMPAAAAAMDHDTPADASTMPAIAATYAVSALIHAGSVPAVDVEAERDCFGESIWLIAAAGNPIGIALARDGANELAAMMAIPAGRRLCELCFLFL
jgi:hypothetical protein